MNHHLKKSIEALKVFTGLHYWSSHCYQDEREGLIMQDYHSI